MKKIYLTIFMTRAKYFLFGLLIQCFIINLAQADKLYVSKFIQEEFVVSGNVTSAESNEPLPGVTIIEKGTNNGTITDIGGNYSLAISDAAATLVFSSVGFNAEEVSVANQAVINIILTPDIQQLQEVVVIGYGSVKKSDLTGSVVSLDQDDFNKGVTTSVGQLLQGRAPGVQITQSSSEPGGGISIRIRGSNSINAGNEPLYVVDGFPLDNSPAVTENGADFNGNSPPRNPLNTLNPADIQSVEILKDASATAIYGSRGANGVVLITTKKGAAGALKVDYNFSYGVSKVANKMDILTTGEYITVMNELAVARGNAPVFSESDIQQIGPGTDWQDQLYRSAALQDHNISLSGGSEKTRFYGSFNYNNQEGVVISSQFERFQGRLNLEHEANDRFKFGINLNTAVTLDDYVPVNGFRLNQHADALNAALNAPPIFDVYDANGEFVRPENGLLVSVTLDNPMALATGVEGKGEVNRTFGNVFAEYKLLPSLTAKLNLASDRANSRRDVFRSTLTNTGQAVGGLATIATGELSNYLVEGTLSFNKNINERHAINAVAGYTYQQFIRRTFSGNTQGFASDVIGTNNLGLGDTQFDELNSHTSKRRLLSYLGRVNYSFNDKYLFTASIRADGSSNFGVNNKFGIFPSFSVAWRLIDEPFMNEVGFFSDLKVRVGWGQIGNDDIGIGNAVATFARAGNAVFGNTINTAVSPARIPNPDLKWEATEQINFGLDFGLIEGRLYGSVDYFIKNTKDLLLELPIPSASGYNFFLDNVGETRNSGLEFLLTSKNLVGDLTWTTTVNFATLKNEVTSLGPISEIIQSAGGTTTILRPGDAMFSYYGYEAEGIFQTTDEIANSAQSEIAEPGVPQWKDVKDDNQITGEDRVVLGDPFPDLTFGFSNTFSYKDFSLSVFIEGVQGVDLFNWQLVDAIYANDPYRNRLSEPLLNRWTSSNPTNKWPSAINDTKYQGGTVNSFTVSDASFIRLKNVQLSYNLPMDKIRFLRSAAVFISGQNLAIMTDYLGFDPDVNSNGSGNIRLDRNAYPSSRSIMLGVNVGL